MKRLNKYITLILLLVFTFPLTYQSYHIMHHHAKDDLEMHDDFCCSDLEADCGDSFAISHTEDDCAVCDYEFTTFDFPQAQSYFTSISAIPVSQSKFIPNRIFGFSGNDIVLRGPPCIL